MLGNSGLFYSKSWLQIRAPGFIQDPCPLVFRKRSYRGLLPVYGDVPCEIWPPAWWHPRLFFLQNDCTLFLRIPFAAEGRGDPVSTDDIRCEVVHQLVPALFQRVHSFSPLLIFNMFWIPARKGTIDITSSSVVRGERGFCCVVNIYFYFYY